MVNSVWQASDGTLWFGTYIGASSYASGEAPRPTPTSQPLVLPAAATLTPTQPGYDPFVGKWVTVDTYDGSTMTLTITRVDGKYALILVDEKASVCGKDANNQPKFAIEIVSTGEVHGMVLNTVSTSAICRTTPQTNLERVFWADYSYQVATDTLRDSNQFLTWKRSTSH